MRTIDFEKYPCPKCGHSSKSKMKDKSPVSGREMYFIKCNSCGWETEKFFFVVLAELSWVDERNIQ